MRRDKSFSEDKLTTEEFSEKYWMSGNSPYQYHSATIEDGRDEREQFVFNNLVALWNRMDFDAKYRRACGNKHGYTETENGLQQRLEDMQEK